MNKILTIFFGLVLIFTIYSGSVSAHVLITDDTKEIGAILHVMPDDDPIAGETSSFMFDIQNQSFSEHSHTFGLSITDENGKTDLINVKPYNNTISATYIFPKQGLYTIKLTAKTDDSEEHTHTFTHSQRVSRGISGGSVSKQKYAWAQAALVISLCGLASLVIIGFNNRKDIKKFSKF